MDKSWLLNRDALRLAKQCIEVIRSELGVKLRLADENFMALLGDYVELLESEQLSELVVALYQVAEIKIGFKAMNPIERKSEVIQFSGRTYPRFQDDKEFKRLYRGQPVYA